MAASKIQFRIVIPCPAVHADGRACEREAGHDRLHWYTVWEQDPETRENWPSYPVEWA